jgi:hypothetical protein
VKALAAAVAAGPAGGAGLQASSKSGKANAALTPRALETRSARRLIECAVNPPLRQPPP